MAVVIVRMRVCDKTHSINASLQEDGKIRLIVDTDCENVRDYMSLLGDTLSQEDVTQRDDSRLFQKDVIAPLTMTCLFPTGIIDACWLELGMLSKTRVLESGSDEIIYDTPTQKRKDCLWHAKDGRCANCKSKRIRLDVLKIKDYEICIKERDYETCEFFKERPTIGEK